jgi:hypothetical protein
MGENWSKLYLTHGKIGCDACGSQGRIVFRDYVQ